MVDKYGRFGGTCRHYIQIVDSEDGGGIFLKNPCTYVRAGLFKTSLFTYQTTQNHIPEDNMPNLPCHRSDNL